MEQRETLLNKQYRGQTLRILSMFYPTPVTVRQIKIALLEYGINNQADIYKHLAYLEDKDYVKYSEGFLKSAKDDDMVALMPKGIDLIEGTIADNGITL